MLGFASGAPLPGSRRCARAATCPRMSFRDNVSALPVAAGSELALLAFRNGGVRSPAHDLVLRNEPGKAASFRIFHAAAAARRGLIDRRAVDDMLGVYAEIVDEARDKPGAHATVDFLIAVKEGEHELRFVCKKDGEYF